MSDELFDGRRIRLLTIVDHFTRESPAIAVDLSLSGPIQKWKGGHRVVEVLGSLALGGRRPETIAVDNGPEFTSKVVDQWAYLNRVALDFSRPGKPTDNALIEEFNVRLHAECLNESWFLSLDDGREKFEAWRRLDNMGRPHSALGNRSPQEFLEAARLA